MSLSISFLDGTLIYSKTKPKHQGLTLYSAASWSPRPGRQRGHGVPGHTAQKAQGSASCLRCSLCPASFLSLLPVLPGTSSAQPTLGLPLLAARASQEGDANWTRGGQGPTLGPTEDTRPPLRRRQSGRRRRGARRCSAPQPGPTPGGLWGSLRISSYCFLPKKGNARPKGCSSCEMRRLTGRLPWGSRVSRAEHVTGFSKHATSD